MKKLKLIIHIATRKDIFIKAIHIAIVVGTILNIINQYDGIFYDESINFLKFFLTYLVPFFVSTYTAVSMKMKFIPGTISSVDLDLKCEPCNDIIHIHEGDTIPICDVCKEKTHWHIV